MPRRQSLCGLLAFLAWAGSAHAQSYSLAEGPLPKSCFRIELTMELTGDVRVQQEGKTIALKQTATARHDFLEHYLEAAQNVAEKSARLYQTAEATIKVDNEGSTRKLRPENALMVAVRSKDLTLTYCPKGLLTQEEMEVTEHLDTLTMPGLLPGKEIAVGATWKIPNQVALGMCDLDGILSNELSGKLSAVQGDLALGEVTGVVKGIDLGAELTLEVKASFHFDLKEKRITRLEWKLSEERKQGPVNPAMSAKVAYVLKRTPILEPSELSAFALVPVLAVPAEKMAPLSYRDPKERFEFQHSRGWHLVSQEEKYVVYRLMDRGDFVAQVTLLPFTKAEPGKMMSLDDFVELTGQAPGWEQQSLLEKSDKVDIPGDGGLKAYRVGASGTFGGTRAVQYFYLVTAPDGRQLIVTFTMDPAQVQKLDSRDLALVRSITFPRPD